MVFKTFFCLLALVGCAFTSEIIKNTIYIISNAEQPSLFRGGLTPVGLRRANECLPQLFSTLNIGKIISCPPDDDSETCSETLDTATPIANALGLPIDTSCGAGENTDDDCVVDLAKDFAKTSSQAILIVWDFNGVGDLIKDNLDLDADDAKAIDGIHYDLITIAVKGQITGVVSQNCTNIDGRVAGTGTEP